MDQDQRWWRRGAPVIGATGVLFVAHLVLTASVRAPTVVFDENGYLGNARALAGGARWEMPYAPFYSGGYSALISPAMALFHDPDQQWRAVQCINSALLASVLPLLYLVLRRVAGVPRRRALVAATVGAIVPAALAAGPSAVAENLVLPAVAGTVLAAWALTDEDAGFRVRRLWFGPLAGLLYAAHPRFSAGLVLALGLLAWWALRHRRDRLVAMVNAAGLVAVTGLAWALNRHLRTVRWVVGVERLEGGPATWRTLVTSVDGWRELALTAAGQAWYLAVGSLGLAVVGVVALVGAARRGDGLAIEAGTAAAAARVGEADGADERRRRRTVLIYVLGLAASVFATSVVFFAQNQFRADHWVYGRHNDSFTTLWVAAGVALLLDRARHRRVLRILGGAIVAMAALGAVMARFRSPGEFGNVFSPFAVPAIARYAEHHPEDMFAKATLLGMAGALLIAAAVWAIGARVPSGRPRRWSQAALAVALGCWCVWAGDGVVYGTARFADNIYDTWTPVPVIEQLGVRELCVDASSVRGRANLSYPWFLPDVDVRTYDAAAGQEPPCTFAVARLDDPARRAAGGRIAALDQGGLYFLWEADDGLAVWVRPGAEQDRLAAAGALLPAGFPTPLPPAARRGDVRLLDPPADAVEVASGDRVHVAVEVTHDGTGSPWPDAASFDRDGRVRVVARVTPEDPDGPPGARSGGELPAWMRPGAHARVDVEVVAVDTLLSPLPPGRYDVQLGIGQVGEDWFTSGGDDARFVLAVTG